MPSGENSKGNLRPAVPGENRFGSVEDRKKKRHLTFHSVLRAADKLAGLNWTDLDYFPGKGTHVALYRWIESDEKNQREFWTKIFPKTIVPPSEDSGGIDFTDTEAAIAAIMAQYIADPGFFKKIMDRAKDSEKLRPILMDLTAEMHVFAVPAEAREITYESTVVVPPVDTVSTHDEQVQREETPDSGEAE